MMAAMVSEASSQVMFPHMAPGYFPGLWCPTAAEVPLPRKSPLAEEQHSQAAPFGTPFEAPHKQSHRSPLAEKQHSQAAALGTPQEEPVPGGNAALEIPGSHSQQELPCSHSQQELNGLRPSQSQEPTGRHGLEDIIESHSQHHMMTPHSQQDMAPHSQHQMAPHSQHQMAPHSQQDMAPHSQHHMAPHSQQDMAPHSQQHMAKRHSHPDMKTPHSEPGLASNSRQELESLPLSQPAVCGRRRLESIKLDEMVARVVGSDGHSWLKYGQKQVQRSSTIRCYYKCSRSKFSASCPAKKTIDIDCHAPLSPHVFQVTYRCRRHNHPALPKRSASRFVSHPALPRHLHNRFIGAVAAAAGFTAVPDAVPRAHSGSGEPKTCWHSELTSESTPKSPLASSNAAAATVGFAASSGAVFPGQSGGGELNTCRHSELALESTLKSPPASCSAAASSAAAGFAAPTDAVCTARSGGGVPARNVSTARHSLRFEQHGSTQVTAAAAVGAGGGSEGAAAATAAGFAALPGTVPMAHPGSGELNMREQLGSTQVSAAAAAAGSNSLAKANAVFVSEFCTEGSEVLNTLRPQEAPEVAAVTTTSTAAAAAAAAHVYTACEFSEDHHATHPREIQWYLPGAPLPGAPLPGAPLPGAPLPGAPLPGAPLPGAPLPGAPLPGVPLPGAPLLELHLPGVYLSEVFMREVLSAGSIQGGAPLSHELEWLLPEVYLPPDAPPPEPPLLGAPPLEPHLPEPHPAEPHPEEPRPAEASMHGVPYAGVIQRGAPLGRRREWPLPEVYLTGAHLPGAHLSGAHLPGAHLSGAHLPGAHLSGAHLPGAHLSGAHLPGADLSVSHLSGAHLSGAHPLEISMHEEPSAQQGAVCPSSQHGVPLEPLIPQGVLEFLGGASTAHVSDFAGADVRPQFQRWLEGRDQWTHISQGRPEEPNTNSSSSSTFE
ncbi:hypothetical protein CLOP_g13441 [Closterium sp. NIES-67]|nr:hypothetical protein CLOP_g13441 [Closterium sp. NIES-67]